VSAAASLPEPITVAGRDGLAALLAAPGQAVVATDYDGTLAPIVDRPEDAIPAPGAIDALGGLARGVGAVAIVSGRTLPELLRLGGLREHPDLGHLLVYAQYGVQRWDAATGEVISPEPGPGVDEVRRRLPALLADAMPGTSIEDKGHALAVHVRRTADPAAAMDQLRDRLLALADETGLEPAPGRMVLELREPGPHKGDAVRQLLAERFGGTPSAVLYAGDDLGDLVVFDELESLRRRGVPGVGVFAESAEVTALRDRADLVVPGPTGVVELFRSLASRLPG